MNHQFQGTRTATQEGPTVEFWCYDCNRPISRSEWRQGHNSRAHWVVPIEFMEDHRSQNPQNTNLSDIPTVDNETYHSSEQSRFGTASSLYSNRRQHRQSMASSFEAEQLLYLINALDKLHEQINILEENFDHLSKQQREQHQVIEQLSVQLPRRNSTHRSSQRRTFNRRSVDYASIHTSDNEELQEAVFASSGNSGGGNQRGEDARTDLEATFNSNLSDNLSSSLSSRLIIATGKVGPVPNLLPQSNNIHVKMEMDSSGEIILFQSIWRDSNPVESKLKVLKMHDNPLYVRMRWKWTIDRTSSLLRRDRTRFQKIPVDFAMYKNVPHVVNRSTDGTYLVEKWQITPQNRISRIGDLRLTETQIDSQNTFSIAGAGKYLLVLQRKSDRSALVLILEGHIITMSYTLKVSVDKQPNFSVVGDYLLFPQSNSFHIVNWKQGGTILCNPGNGDIRTVRVPGDDWVLGPITLADSSTYILEFHNGEQNDAVVYQTEQLQPVNLDHAQIAGIRQNHFGLFSTGLEGVMLFYNKEVVGLLQVTKPTYGYVMSADPHPGIHQHTE